MPTNDFFAELLIRSSPKLFEYGASGKRAAASDASDLLDLHVVSGVVNRRAPEEH